MIDVHRYLPEHQTISKPDQLPLLIGISLEHQHLIDKDSTLNRQEEVYTIILALEALVQVSGSDLGQEIGPTEYPEAE